jgi:archaellum component FlaC
MHHDKIHPMTLTAPLTLEKLDSKLDAKFDFVMKTMDERFAVVDAKFDQVIQEMRAGFKAADEKFDATIELMMAGFESMDARFNRVESHLDRHDKQIASLSENVRDVQSRTIHLEESMEEVQYSLAVLTKAEEKDAEATINHELRLQRLEKINKVKAIPPSHLIDIQA